MKLSAPEKTAHEASPKYRHTKDHRQWADFCKETWEVTREWKFCTGSYGEDLFGHPNDGKIKGTDIFAIQQSNGRLKTRNPTSQDHQNCMWGLTSRDLTTQHQIKHGYRQFFDARNIIYELHQFRTSCYIVFFVICAYTVLVFYDFFFNEARKVNNT